MAATARISARSAMPGLPGAQTSRVTRARPRSSRPVHARAPPPRREGCSWAIAGQPAAPSSRPGAGSLKGWPARGAFFRYLRHRHIGDEQGAGAFGALDDQAAAMAVDDVLDDRETEAGAGAPARPSGPPPGRTARSAAAGCGRCRGRNRAPQPPWAPAGGVVGGEDREVAAESETRCWRWPATGRPAPRRPPRRRRGYI